MNILTKIRRGEGPFWGTLKKIAKTVRRLHIPVFGPTRLLYKGLYLVHTTLWSRLAWARRFFWYEPLFRSQCAEIGKGLQIDRLPFISGNGRIVLGNNVTLIGKIDIGFSNRVRDLPELVIGDHSLIGHSTSLGVADSIRIGKHVLFASGVRIADFDGHPLDAERRRANEPTPPEAIKSVVIEDDVWVGTDAKIMKGVTVGARSVVAAFSVVTKDVPPDVVVAGNPARVVKHLKPVDSAPETPPTLSRPTDTAADGDRTVVIISGRA